MKRRWLLSAALAFSGFAFSAVTAQAQTYSDVNWKTWNGSGTASYAAGSSVSAGNELFVSVALTSGQSYNLQTVFPSVTGKVGDSVKIGYSSDLTNWTWVSTQTLNSATEDLSATFSLTSTGTMYFAVQDATNAFSEASQPTVQDAPLPPVVPTGLSASASDGTVSLSWSSGGVADSSYNVYENGTKVGNTSSTSYTVSGLTDGTTYSFQVSGVNTAGTESSLSSSVTAKPMPPLPSAPTGVAVSSVTGTGADVAWSSVSGATAYNVYVNGSLYESGVTGTSCNVTGLTPGTAYAVTVTSVNITGEGSGSVGASFITLSVPSVPTGLIASYVTGDSAHLSWNPVSGATSYTLYNTFTGVAIASGVTSTSYDWSGLSSGTNYTVAVSATNSVGEGAKSAAITVSTLSPPVAPTGLVGSVGDGTVTLTWNAVSGAKSYNVYRNGTEVASGGTALSFTDSGLTDGTSYSYTVTAVNAVGESSQSASLSLTPKKVVAPVSGLQLQAGKTELYAQWTGSDKPFTVSWSLNGTQVGSVSTSTNSYMVGNLQANTTYSVTVTDAGGRVVTQSINTGNQSVVIVPAMPDPTPLHQNIVNLFGTGGAYALYVIGGAVALGVMVVVGIWLWRRTKQWLRAVRN